MINEQRQEEIVDEGPRLYTADNGALHISFAQGSSLELPTALGKVLQFSLRVHHFHTLNMAREYPARRRATHIYERMGCHTFVAKCLGFPLPLQYLRIPSYTAHKRYFSPEQFKLHSGDEDHAFSQLQKRVTEAGEEILIGQVMRSPGDLTHSFLLLKIGDTWLSLEKSGTGGKFNMRHLEDALYAWRKSYGCHIALAPYETIANRADLHEWYTKPHYSL